MLTGVKVADGVSVHMSQVSQISVSARVREYSIAEAVPAPVSRDPRCFRSDPQFGR